MKNILPPIEYFFGNTPLRNWIANIKPFVPSKKMISVSSIAERIFKENEPFIPRIMFSSIVDSEDNYSIYREIWEDGENSDKLNRFFIPAYHIAIDPISDYWNKFGKRDNEYFAKEQEDFHAEVLKTAQYFNSTIIEEDPEAMQNLKDRMEQARRELFDPDFIGPKRHIPKPDLARYKNEFNNWLYGIKPNKGELPIIIGHTGHGKSSFGIMEHLASMERKGHVFVYPELSEDILLDRINKYKHEYPADIIQPFNLECTNYHKPTQEDPPERKETTKELSPKDNTPWYVKASGGYKNKKNRRK